MRSTLILVLMGTLVFLPGVIFAETAADCLAACAAEKASRDDNCPSQGDDVEQARAQCLQESQDAYNSCLSKCQQPASSETPAQN